MAIDNFEISDEKVNIKGLTVSEPVKTNEFPFPISDEIWNFSLQKLHEAENRPDLEIYIGKAREISILLSNSLQNPLKTEISNSLQNNREGVHRYLTDLYEWDYDRDVESKYMLESFLHETASVKLLCPDLIKNYAITNEQWSELANHIEASAVSLEEVQNYTEIGMFSSYLRQIANAKMINPDIVSQIPSLSLYKDHIKDIFEYAKTQDNVDTRDSDLAEVFLPALDIASSLKMIDPELFKKLEISNGDQDRWKKYLDKTAESKQEQYFSHYMSYAACLAIVKSEKIDISESRINISMPTINPLSETMRVPEVRKF